MAISSEFRAYGLKRYARPPVAESNAWGRWPSLGTGRRGVQWNAGRTRATLQSSGVRQVSPSGDSEEAIGHTTKAPPRGAGPRDRDSRGAPRPLPDRACGGRSCHVARPEAPDPAARVPALDRGGPTGARPQNPLRPACQVQGRAREDAARSGPRGILRVDRALSAVPADRERAQVCGKGRRPSASLGSVGEGGWVPT